MTDRSTYLLCYDIREPTRLRRVHRLMRTWGEAIQYSVFRCLLSASERRRMLEMLRQLIDERADDVRLYQIETRTPIRFLGSQPMVLDDVLFG